MNTLLFELENHLNEFHAISDFWEMLNESTLSFELLPIVAFIGSHAMSAGEKKYYLEHATHFERWESQKTEALKDPWLFLAPLFGVEAHNVSACLEIETFLRAEVPYIKRNSAQRRSSRNQMQYEELVEILLCGIHMIEYFEKEIPKPLSHLKGKIVQPLPIRMLFSRQMRYVLNGLHERFWYEETSESMHRLFPEFNQKLICDLLAATSIRASVESNVKKFLQALRQIFLNEQVHVLVKQRDSIIPYETRFPGHLNAAMFHLDSIFEGKSLADAVDFTQASKIKNFSKAMYGDPQAVPVDVHIMRSFGTDIKYRYKKRLVSRAPTSGLSSSIHKYIRLIAQVAHIDPRQYSAMVWAGIRSEGNQGSTRFGTVIEKRFNHGLFGEQYGKLIKDGNEVKFFQK